MSIPDQDTPAPTRVSRLALILATGGGLGLLRPAPGTWGSLGAGLAAILTCRFLPGWWSFLVLASAAVGATLVGLAVCGPAARYFGQEDPGQVVIDETAGVWLGLALFPPAALQAWPVALPVMLVVVFRIYDILKPWPIRACERLPGAWGIMVDDLVAGVLAACTCHLLKPLVLV